MEDTIKIMAMIKLSLPQNASYSLRLPAQQHAPIIHKSGQNLCIHQNKSMTLYHDLPAK